MAAAVAFSFLAARSNAEGAGIHFTALNQKQIQNASRNYCKIRHGKEGRGGGIANPAPFTLLEGTRATKGIHRGEKNSIRRIKAWGDVNLEELQPTLGGEPKPRCFAAVQGPDLGGCTASPPQNQRSCRGKSDPGGKQRRHAHACACTRVCVCTCVWGCG